MNYNIIVNTKYGETLHTYKFEYLIKINHAVVICFFICSLPLRATAEIINAKKRGRGKTVEGRSLCHMIVQRQLIQHISRT